ncbi:hypothetical protein AX16_006007 [Volvariella volvacea WC 439]|nr:hypothetical protein AX16_006007 [Volvariella volvacea WC 439]
MTGNGSWTTGQAMTSPDTSPSSSPDSSVGAPIAVATDSTAALINASREQSRNTVSSTSDSSPITSGSMFSPPNSPPVGPPHPHPPPPPPPPPSHPPHLARPTRTLSTGSFVSSPLNPSAHTPTSPPSAMSNHFPRSHFNSLSSRPPSRTSSHYNHKFAPEEGQPSTPYHTHFNYHTVNSNAPSGASTPANTFPSSSGTRGSMILYHISIPTSRNSVAAGGATAGTTALAPPPRLSKIARDSVMSSSGESIAASFQDADSKYPLGLGLHTQRGVVVPYEYDPAMDEMEPPDEEDFMHDPKYGGKEKKHSFFPWRGIMNVSVLMLLILGLLCLFVFYPVWEYFRDRARNEAIDGNIRINATGQAPVFFQMPEMIDPETPDNARTRTGFDGQAYELVFSDEFNTPGRTFYPGDDPFWEAVDLWYGATGDLEWYDPSQVTTRDGALVITMDSIETGQPGLTPGSTAPFTPLENHLLNYRSGMVQTWNKFCFTTGYIEVSVVLPGPDQNTAGYWPGAWTMGNLARPGYPATTDGMWPYTYNTCDVGTFPNQTLRDGSGPAAALYSPRSRSRYNYELSWLSGQRLSACSCPGSDHPGPTVDTGRGAPEIDIFEAEKDKDYPIGHVVSQSAQFAPFSHDYFYDNSTEDAWRRWEYPTADGIPRTRRNSYQGSAVQQSVSGITRLPEDMFQGTGRVFKTFGFEYWSNPNNPDEGSITWQVDGRLSHRMGAAAVAPDMGPEGSQVGQRLIPVEPMAIVLNLGMSPNWQQILPETMMFPAEFMIDYVRVYQRSDSINYGCDPEAFPTADYINRHIQAYRNVNMTQWPGEIPRNRLWEGSC